jgi:hypothetical protein
VPDRVQRAMHRAAPNIYEGELHSLTASLWPDLRAVAGTVHNVVCYIGNGHALWEAVNTNLFSRGDKVLVLASGAFGLGWAYVASAMGVDVEIMDFGRSSAPDMARVEARLRADVTGQIVAVLTTHVDTATTARTDVVALRAAMDRAGHPALLAVDCIASMGCDVVATDLGSGDERRTPWQQTGQWVGQREALNQRGLCGGEEFARRVSFRPVDMNEIPDDLDAFDFTWSSCSFEHCGTLDLGLRFLERQMACLRPGGVAVHTTEFNLSSNDATVATGPYVIYRLRDIEDIVRRLRRAGHHVEPLDVGIGDHPLDRFIDRPPFNGPAAPGHLRLELNGFVSTSIGLIITKGRPAAGGGSIPDGSVPRLGHLARGGQ